ncbi:MAG: AAA domain-containing protein [Cyanobacteria bacterium P01_F01_bin.150]
MTTSHTLPMKKVSKSTMSMFLRTRCDKELYLSLHDKKALKALGLPAQVKRPGIGILSVEGRKFEEVRNDQLVRLFPKIITFKKIKTSYKDIDLEAFLLKITAPPQIILQGRFSISSSQNLILKNLGLSSSEIANIPEISDFIPDVIIVRQPKEGDIEICTDASRSEISAGSEARLAIEIIDIKHTNEANASYCSEIALYALMLTNWLHLHSTLSGRFYVNLNSYLWTRFKQGESELEHLEKKGGATTEELLQALISDSEDANLRFYLAAVRQFFENVVRVIKEAYQNGWENLEWHVSSRCSNCDWLGDKRHLSKEDKNTVDSNPNHYCLPFAKVSDHLSLVPGISHGAKRILHNNAVNTTADLAHAHGNKAFQEHTTLKREARHLPQKSNAILSSTLNTDVDAVIASLIKSANLLIYASINFDASAGLLTGLSISGTATNFKPGIHPRTFQATAFVVDQKNLAAEWVALEAFLSSISEYLNYAIDDLKIKNPKGQIHFWEHCQFQELCNAMGRHLPRILAFKDKRMRALAWIFSPDELIAQPESLQASTVVTLEHIIQRMVFTPTPHAITLFGTSESYPENPKYLQRETDSYYREYLSNSIPRERIYEIWRNASQIKRGSKLIPRNTAITRFSKTLEKQVKALESICGRLRHDYKDSFKAKATYISPKVPGGAQKVAFDSKLWIWWDSLEFNVSQLEDHIRLSIEGERLEATYEALILKNGVKVTPEIYQFDVAKGSTEAKFKELDGVLTLGKIGRPGMPLEKAKNLLHPRAIGSFTGNQDIFNMPLWSILKPVLIEFDRVGRKAKIKLLYDQDPSFIPFLLKESTENLLTDVFLLESKKPSYFNWEITSRKILKAIGNPPIAKADSNAANAMGLKASSKLRRGGTDTLTPAAQILWDATTMEQNIVVPKTIAHSIATYAASHNDLNSSQLNTVEHAAERSLTVIWGPPGTGKTKTISAFLHGLIQEGTQNNRSLKILVTGPTYKAVEEVMHRTANIISQDPTAVTTMYACYSWSRALGPTPGKLNSNVSYKSITIDTSHNEFKECLKDLTSAQKIVIVGCSIRQARRFPQEIMDSPVAPLFDIAIIDESSQVPVSHSLSALCGLKENSRLVVAGDHLQMPPISSIDPPVDAAYLVGSIQTYLRKRHSTPPSTLETNYRSSKDIVAYAKQIGYPASLQAHFPSTALYLLKPPSSRSKYPPHLPWCDQFTDLLAPEHQVMTLLHEDEISSQGNHFEAKLVAGIVWMLRQSVSVELDGRGTTTHNTPNDTKFWSKCVGIVTPHRAQRALVIRELEQLFAGEQKLIDEAVDTVERFQGGERHTIIVSFGVADIDVISGEEAFLMQLERTNVAISRAMAKCITVMPKSLASYIPADKKTLNTAFALKDYIEEFCNMRVNTKLSDATHTRKAQIRYHQ